MNTYSKYVPNVFLAKCESEHERGEEITMTTKYGQEHEVIVFNLIYQRDGFFFYSIVRADGFNHQERARSKAERLSGYAGNAQRRSNEFWKKSDMSEEATGIPFGQPILVGHHSESRHRRTIEKADNAMRKSVEESGKAEEYERRAAYWANKANTINLSMPESLEFYEFELEKAKANHAGLKNGTIEKRHSYSLTYAKKEVNDIESKLNLAKRLWG